MQSSQKTKDTEQFFNQWNIYQRVIEKNYMVHDQISATLQRFLQTLSPQPKSFLDLGCGDAFMAIKILQGTAMEQYWGIDLSSIALQFAETNLNSLLCAQHFVNEDLTVAITNYVRKFDIVCAGYSLHHLRHNEKQEFFKRCAKALKPESIFLMYDLVKIETETREQCLQRHWQAYSQWDFSESELDSIKTHVFKQDYAESYHSLNEIAINSGFKKIETLFIDQNSLFAVYCFYN